MFTEEDTNYKKHCTWDNDASVPFKVGTLGPHTVLPMPAPAPLYFLKSHQQSEISSLSGDFSFGKSQKSQGAKSGL